MSCAPWISAHLHSSASRPQDDGYASDIDCLADALWEGSPPSSFAATLESHVSVVRRHLEHEDVARTALRTVHNGYVLTDEVAVDLTDTREMLRTALLSPPATAFEIVQALPPCRIGDLLASSPYASFATSAREEIRTLLATGLRRASEGALERHLKDRALTLARRAHAADPVSDATEQTVMRALLALDARCDALREYADFRQRVREELGVDPSGTTQLLYLDALARGASEERSRREVERHLLLRLLRQVPDETSRIECEAVRSGGEVRVAEPA